MNVFLLNLYCNGLFTCLKDLQIYFVLENVIFDHFDAFICV